MDDTPVPPLRYEWTSTSIMVWFPGPTNIYGELSPPRNSHRTGVEGYEQVTIKAAIDLPFSLCVNTYSVVPDELRPNHGRIPRP